MLNASGSEGKSVEKVILLCLDALNPNPLPHHHELYQFPPSLCAVLCFPVGSYGKHFAHCSKAAARMFPYFA